MPSRARTWPRGYLAVPAFDANEFRGAGDPRWPHEVDDHEGGNVRNREFIARNEARIRQLLIEQGKRV